MITFEVMLPLGALAFYFFDSALLLFGNELALQKRGRRWTSSPGSAFQFAGRRIFMPNPLTPAALLFRVSWQPGSRSGAGDSLDPAELARVLRPLRVIVTAQAFLLIVMLAPVTIVLGSGPELLLLFAAYYALSLASITALVVRRRVLHVNGRACWAHALEILACAPFAVNLVRKLTLRRSAELPWLGLVRTEFDAAGRTAMEAAIAGQIELLLLDQEPGSEKEIRLTQFQADLRERLHGLGSG